MKHVIITRFSFSCRAPGAPGAPRAPGVPGVPGAPGVPAATGVLPPPPGVPAATGVLPPPPGAVGSGLPPPPSGGGLFGPSPALMAQDAFLSRPASSLSPQDRWLQMQLETLQRYFALAQRHQAIKKQQQRKKDGGGGGGAPEEELAPDPVLDEMLARSGGLPANIGPDPHLLGSKTACT